MIHIFTSVEKYFSISINLVINGNGEEIFPKFEQGVAILGIFATFQYFGKYWKRILNLPVPWYDTRSVLFWVDF